MLLNINWTELNYDDHDDDDNNDNDNDQVQILKYLHDCGMLKTYAQHFCYLLWLRSSLLHQIVST